MQYTKLYSKRIYAALVWRCLQGLAPIYLLGLGCLTSGIQWRRSLRYVEKVVCLVSFACTPTMRNRAFSVVDPVLWNGLPLDLCLHPGLSQISSLKNLKLFFWGALGHGLLDSRRPWLELGAPLRCLLKGRYINFRMNE